MRVLERLLDEEHISTLDLGAGDDPYKRLSASRRGARCGLLAFDPLTWRGAAGALRGNPGGTFSDGSVCRDGMARRRWHRIAKAALR